jgi:surface antigen
LSSGDGEESIRMRAFGTGTTAWLLGSALLLSCPFVVHSAQAAQYGQTSVAAVQPTVALRGHLISTHMTLERGTNYYRAMRLAAVQRGATRFQGISCVPYARQVSGIQVAGNAWEWWKNAAGLYARGERPEAGSVLNFRSNGRMRLGHVAVVTRVVNAREVIVDHANWPSGGAGGGISRGVAVVDVSEANNWSAVRVELGRASTFGSVYPTYGFIYNRPDTGRMVASIVPPAPQASINPVPSDLRPAAERPWRTMEEVAEAPANPHRIDLTVSSTAATVGQ